MINKISSGMTIQQTQASLRMGSTAIRDRFPDVFKAYIKRWKREKLIRRVRIVEFWVGNGYCNQNEVAKRLHEVETFVSSTLSQYLPVPPADGAMITLKSRV